ncbi:Ig-like domain-containing protein [Peribacillus sp. SCS-155]|uniref:Ig-like domain-containing protein n=1 Tax=Peribacillus sedimenti TaxID=3115297 RepID=UPI0039059957
MYEDLYLCAKGKLSKKKGDYTDKVDRVSVKSCTQTLINVYELGIKDARKKNDEVALASYNDMLSELKPLVKRVNEGVGNWELISLGKLNGFFGAAFKNPKNGDIVIAFRGTDDLEDIAYDAKHITAKLRNTELAQYNPALLLVQSVLDGYPDFYLTGHSLGGFLAQKVAADIQNPDVWQVEDVIYSEPGAVTLLKTQNFQYAETFNGPGVILRKKPLTKEQENKLHNTHVRIVDHVMGADRIGSFSISLGKTHSYQKKGKTHGIAHFYGVKLKPIPSWDRTAPKAPYVAPFSVKDTMLYGKTEKNAMVKIKIDFEVVAWARTNSKGEFVVRLRNQTPGTEILVYAIDEHGNDSVTSIRVQEKGTTWNGTYFGPFGELKITNQSSAQFDFNLRVIDGKNVGEVISHATYVGIKGSVLKVGNYTCDMTFTRNADSITIEEKACSSYHGAGIEFSGTYRQKK